MKLPLLSPTLIAFVDRYRPALFSPVEWWFHLLSMPVMLPVGAYYFMGWRYFQAPITFVVGTVVNVFVYWFTITLFTLAVRWVIRQFPALQQAGIRIVAMLLLVGLIMAVMAVAAVWLFSVVPGTGVQFTWEAVTPIWLFGSIASPIFCLALGMFYIYSQWQDRQTEIEQLKRQAIQQQYDALKSQVNPHFLFNSLNSVSLLIGEDPAGAERFVDQLAKVYRYLLQAGKHDLVSLETELDFLTSYTHLLQVRYGDSLQLNQAIDPGSLSGQLPPLTLQLLTDNAIRHNSMAPNRPLTINISTRNSRLVVASTLQRKRIRVDTNTASLATLIAKYQLLTEAELVIEEGPAQFSVSVPLL